MSDVEILRRLTDLLEGGRPAALCTLIEKRGSAPRGVGAKMIVDADGNSYGTIGGGDMERKIVKEALEAIREGRPRVLSFALGVEPGEGAIPVESMCGGEVRVFIDVLRPEPKLIIIGSGHIAKPLATLAEIVGLEAIVVDDAETATAERFPKVRELRTGPFERELEELKVRPSDFVAIVHGDERHELEALRRMLGKTGYIGLLGSRRKAEAHKRRLMEMGFNEEDVRRIHAPIGLDIGATTPEEIAISIMAEIIRERRRGPHKAS
ncbi:MAG: XdhC family protein [Candidatus Bathyarchaeia archaeon]